MEKCYQKEQIGERHRHRYEFNNDYRALIEEHGMVVSGTSPDGHIVEAVEIPENRFYVGVQFHPEFKSRPNPRASVVLEFVKAALEHGAEAK